MNLTRDLFPVLRKTGWRIWYFQNILLFIPLCLLPLNFFSKKGEIGGVINLSFYLAFFLDIFSIFLISLTVMVEFILHRKNKKHSIMVILIPFCGILWILVSIIWRFQFYVQEPYNFGFSIRRQYKPLEDTIYNEFFYNPLIKILLVSNSIVLLLFFLIQDNFLLFEKQTFKFKSRFTGDIGTLFGLTNFFSNFLIFLITLTNVNLEQFPSYSPMQFLLILTCWISQLLFVPILGMRTARKYIACMGMSSPSYEISSHISSYKDSVKLWFKKRIEVCQPIDLTPSKKTITLIIILTLLLFTQPVSPFFIRKLSPSPYIIGPYITRNASKDNLAILQHVENLNLYKITGVSGDFFGLHSNFFMTNSTLKYFLNRIASKSAYYYLFRWTVSIREREEYEVKVDIDHYWRTNDVHPNFVAWWINGTLNKSYNTSALHNVRLSVRWIFWGSFQYDEKRGPLAAIWIDGYQLLFLNEDLGLVFLGIGAKIMVA